MALRADAVVDRRTMRPGNLADLAARFGEALSEHGILPSSPIVPDGKLHRVHVEGDHPSSQNGWYILFPDHPGAGAFGCWKRGVKEKWCARPEHELDPAEREAFQRRMKEAREQRERAESQMCEQAVQRARSIWDPAPPADPAHPYLRRKRVAPHGIRQHGGRLLVPVSADGVVYGLQFISSEGEKRFLPGTMKRGHYHRIEGPADTIVIAEGYATAASIHENTGHAAVVAFDCRNLRPVAEAIRAKFPEARIILAADNDGRMEDNPGLRHATEAAQAVGGLLAVPEFADGERGTDWNDVMILRGAAAVKDGIAHARLAHGSAIEPTPLMRTLSQAEPFPVAALGPLLAAATLAIHERVQAPLAVCGQSVLAAATLAAQAHADVVLPTGQAKPLSEFFLTVAGTGERKTAVDTWATAAIRERETELVRDHQAELPGWRNRNEAWEKQRTQILGDKNKYGNLEDKARALNAIGPPPPAPLKPLLTCPDPTFEGLTLYLAAGQPSVGVFSGEGGQFVGGHGLSAEHKLKTGAGLSAVWDGEPIKRVRAGDGTTVITGRRVAMHLMVQPEVAAGLLADPVLRDQGLLSRVLVVAPASAAGTRLWQDPTPGSLAALRQYDQRLLRILRAPPAADPGAPNELRPRRLPLSGEATQMWISFADLVERQLGPDCPFAPIRGLANKLPEHAARLAAVLALIDDVQTEQVGPDHLTCGIALVEHYAAEALRLYEAGLTDPDLRDAQRLLDWLVNGWDQPLVSLSDMYQRGPAAVRSAKRARQLAKILEEHGWVLRLDLSAEVAGKRRKDVWRIWGKG